MSRTFPKTPTGYLAAADGARKLKAKRIEVKGPTVRRSQRNKKTTRPGE